VETEGSEWLSCWYPRLAVLCCWLSIWSSSVPCTVVQSVNGALLAWVKGFGDGIPSTSFHYGSLSFKKMVLFGKNKIQILTVENRRKNNHGLWNIQLTFPFCSIWSGCRRRLGELCRVYFKRLGICMNRQKWEIFFMFLHGIKLTIQCRKHEFEGTQWEIFFEHEKDLKCRSLMCENCLLLKVGTM
jgi:hypothetical protein